VTSLDNVRRVDKVLRNVAAFDEAGLVSMDQAGTRGFSLEVRILEEILIEVFCNDIGWKSFALHAPGFFGIRTI
jgi:hypothetical protein